MRTFRRSADSLSADLEAAKSVAFDAVKAATGAVRLRFLTDIPGQELIYNEKRQEATLFLALDPAPTDLTPYPFLAAEVGITAPTAAEVAAVFLARAALWVEVGAALEAIRLSTVQRIETALTEAEIADAVSAMEQELTEL